MQSVYYKKNRRSCLTSNNIPYVVLNNNIKIRNVKKNTIKRNGFAIFFQHIILKKNGTAAATTREKIGHLVEDEAVWAYIDPDS